MKPRKANYLVHRWIGLIVSVQLLAWSLGGLTFSVLNLQYVRGERHTPDVQPRAIDAARVAIGPTQAIERAADIGVAAADVAEVHLRMRAGTAQYLLLDGDQSALATVDAASGIPTTRISPEKAKEIAQAGFAPEAQAASVVLLEDTLPLEARGRRLPLYRVDLDHPSHPRLYIDAVSGEIVARRNTAWRVFDFFWMLHIMDYGQRENFNHLLLTAMSILAVLTSGSGLLLWGWRVVPSRRRTSAPPVPAAP